MSLTIDFDASDIATVISVYDRAPQIVDEELGAFMYAGVAHLQGEVQERTPTAYGTLRASIIGDVRQLGGLGIEGTVGTSLAYAVPVELGTGPHMPPVEPLAEWARLKLGLRGKEAESAAWGIAKAIARRGTLGVGMFNRAFVANRQELIRQFGRAVQRIVRRAGVGR